MKFCLFLIMLILIIPLNSYSMGGLEEFMMEMQYKYELTNGNKNILPFNSSVECPKILEHTLTTWKKNSNLQKSDYILEGEMGKSFSENEILNMANANIHGVLGKVRGSDKILADGYSFGGGPAFPHSWIFSLAVAATVRTSTNAWRATTSMGRAPHMHQNGQTSSTSFFAAPTRSRSTWTSPRSAAPQ